MYYAKFNCTVDVCMYLFISLFTYLFKKYGNNSDARRQQLRKKVEQKKNHSPHSPDLFDTEVRPLVVKQSFSVQSGAKKSSDTTKW